MFPCCSYPFLKPIGVPIYVIYVPRPILILYLCICLVMNMKYVDRLVFPIILYYDPVNRQR